MFVLGYFWGEKRRGGEIENESINDGRFEFIFCNNNSTFFLYLPFFNNNNNKNIIIQENLPLSSTLFQASVFSSLLSLDQFSNSIINYYYFHSFQVTMVTTVQNHHQTNSTSTFLQFPLIAVSPFPLFPMYVMFPSNPNFPMKFNSDYNNMWLGFRMRRWGWCWVQQQVEDGQQVLEWKVPLFLLLERMANLGMRIFPLSHGHSSLNLPGEGCSSLLLVPSVPTELLVLLILMLTLMALFSFR